MASLLVHEGCKAGNRRIQVAAASYLDPRIANGLVVVPGYPVDGAPAAARNIFGSVDS